MELCRFSSYTRGRAATVLTAVLLLGAGLAGPAAAGPPTRYYPRDVPSVVPVGATYEEEPKRLPEKLPTPQAVDRQPRRGGGPEPLYRPGTGLPPPAAEAPEALPINLDTVFRLAQDQNGQVQIARAKLQEAFANREVAEKAWLPDLFAGYNYYRHEGSIQDQTGRILTSSFGSMFGGLELNGRFDLKEAVFARVDAERRIWQQRGELTKMTSENLLDAVNTYVDLVTARSAEALSVETEEKLEKVLEDAKKLRKIVGGGFQTEVDIVQSQLYAQRQITREMQAGARRAGAKLAYLLGLDPCAELVVMDRVLVPFDLIDPAAPPEQLVQEALTNGPGVRELQGLLALVHENQQRAGWSGYIPVVELRSAEGGFGGGPGGSQSWNNRWDGLLQIRWNLTSHATQCERQRVTEAQLLQLHLTDRELRAKLTLGVREALEDSAGNRDRMAMARREIETRKDVYEQAKYRLADFSSFKDKGASPSNVVLAAGSLVKAQFAYLTAMQDYDKAQLRLLILTGMNCAPAAGPEIVGTPGVGIGVITGRDPVPWDGAGQGQEPRE